VLTRGSGTLLGDSTSAFMSKEYTETENGGVLNSTGKTRQFYFSALLPELAVPRYRRGGMRGTKYIYLTNVSIF